MDGFRMTDNNLVPLIDFLSELSNSDTSNESQNAIMQRLLRQLDFNNAIVVYGVVYLEGRGTRSAPPTSINAIAKMVLKMVKA